MRIWMGLVENLDATVFDIEDAKCGWTPDDGIDEHVIIAFTTGGCAHLVRALIDADPHLVAKGEVDTDYEDYHKFGGGLEHCWAERLDYKVVDINGVQDSIAKNHERVVKLNEEAIESMVNECPALYQWATELVSLFPAHFGL